MRTRPSSVKRQLAHWWYDLIRPRIAWMLASVFRWLPLPSSVLGPPKGVIWDADGYVRGWQNRAPWSQRGSGHWILPVCGEEIFSFSGRLPEYAAFSGRMNHSFAAVSVTHLRYGRLALREGVVISPEDRVFDAFTHNWGDSIWKHPVFRRAKMPPLRSRRGEYATIVTPGAPRNYFHWLWDALPRIAVLERAGLSQFTLIVSDRIRPWQVDSLMALGYPPERWVEFGDEYWEVDSILVPSFVHETGFCRPWAVEWLRKRLMPGGETKHRKRIYLSRRMASRRRLLNEEEIVALLEREGFEEIAAENLSFRQQIELFAQAEAVVAPHGAGLTNLLFAPEGTRVVELFSPRYINPCFFSLCLVRQHPYSCVIGKTEASGSKTDWVTMAEDFIVRPEDMLAALR